jgi:hypothetical protein
MSLTAHPSTFAIDTQQLVNLKRNGHSKSLVDDGPGKGTSVCSLAVTAASVAATVVRQQREHRETIWPSRLSMK